MTWLRDTFAVLRELGIKPSAACVAGGRALQTLLPKFETKDTDIFIMHSLSGKAALKLSKMGAELIRHDIPDAEISASDPQTRAEHNYHLGDLDLVFCQHDTVQEVLENFDLGVCQIAYQLDSGLLVMTQAAVRDITEHMVTLLRDEPTANHRARAAKYAQRLGWPIRAEEAF